MAPIGSLHFRSNTIVFWSKRLRLSPHREGLKMGPQVRSAKPKCVYNGNCRCHSVKGKSHMRKQLVLILTVMLVLTFTVGVVNATPTAELTALAQYYPSETPLFLTLRTDDAFLEKLDGVWAQVNSNLGEPFPLLSRMTVKKLINQALGEALLDYDSDIGPWLGDTAAVGILPIEDFEADPDFLLAVEIDDRAAAEDLISLILSFEGNGEPTAVTDDYVIYNFGDAVALIADDVMLISISPVTAMAAFDTDGESLADNATFNETAALLPSGDYDMFFFENVGSLVDTLMTAMQEEMAMESDYFPGLFADLWGMAEDASLAAGVTITDSRNLIVDAASQMSSDAMAMMTQTPVNPDFAAHVPGNAPLVILDNGFGPDTLAIFDMLDTIGPLLQAEFELLLPMMADEMGPGMMDDESAMAMELLEGLDLSILKFGGMLKNGIIPFYAGFTGLNLEDDVLSWMTGDYAAYIRLLPLDSEIGVTIDLNFTTEASDPAKADYIVDRLTEVAGLYNLDVVTEQHGGGDALALPTFVPLLFPGYLQDTAMATEEFALMVGANGEVFTAGTRPGVEFALAPSGESLRDNPAFNHAVDNLFLPNPTSIFYMSTGGFVDTMLKITELDMDMEEAQALAYVLSQVESLTVTSSMPDDGVSLSRLTLTIPEAVPFPPPPSMRGE